MAHTPSHATPTLCQTLRRTALQPTHLKRAWRFKFKVLRLTQTSMTLGTGRKSSEPWQTSGKYDKRLPAAELTDPSTLTLQIHPVNKICTVSAVNQEDVLKLV
ncbi:hypothetical protein MRX96_024837 [Rhipicephalus microplus]